MINELKELLNNSYSPRSKFRVAAIVEMNDGILIDGVNVENASYGASICAERVAITSAIAKGYKKGDFKSLHVLCGDSKKVSMPCFVCRQVIVEFFSLEQKIYAYSIMGEVVKKTVQELCPFPFDETDLDV